MSALVFVGTYFFKIPSAFGYTHLGDCMHHPDRLLIWHKTRRPRRCHRRRSLRFLGGYAVWVLHVIKRSLGVHRRNYPPSFCRIKYSWLVGAIVGGIAHIIGYTLVKIPLYGTVVAFGEMFTLSMQTIAGIVLGGVATRSSHSPRRSNIKGKICVTTDRSALGFSLGLYKIFTEGNHLNRC